ncbi:MAG: methyltransferase domain-containing protein [Pirellulales bacterium]
MSTYVQSPADELPRCDSPIPQAQPQRLAAIARMRGLSPAAVDTARVLEIGCGNGSNLIPLAERYPAASFVGIDGSARAIAAATEEAHTLGLANVAFERRSIGELPNAGEPLDYILAPDVYSWVDAATRDALLTECRARLAPQGLVYLNHNVYPGWKFHEMLGAMMRFAAKDTRTAAERLAAGRSVLEFMLATLPADDPGYGGMLSAIARPILQQPDAIVLRNYLLAPGQAAYYRQFARHVGAHQLQVLGDAALSIRAYDYLSARQERELAAIATDPDEQEELRDVLQNKSHRQSILCHAGLTLDRAAGAFRLRGLYLEGRLTTTQPDSSVELFDLMTFTAPDGTSVETGVPVVKAALAHLGAVWPSSVEFDELLKQARQRVEGTERTPAPMRALDVRRLEDNVLQCCVGGLVQVHGAPPSFVGVVSERPVSSPLARRQAAHDEIATNRRHQPVRLEPFDRYVLSLLDGTRSVADIVDHLVTGAANGQLALVENGRPVPPERATAFASNELAASIKRLVDSAFLIA